jgi:hypothetical protein
LNREILLVLLLLVITVKLPYTKGVYLGVAVSADARLTQAHFCSKDLLFLGITDGFVCVQNVVECSVVKLLFKAVLAKGAKNIAAGYVACITIVSKCV